MARGAVRSSVRRFPSPATTGFWVAVPRICRRSRGPRPGAARQSLPLWVGVGTLGEDPPNSNQSDVDPDSHPDSITTRHVRATATSTGAPTLHLQMASTLRRTEGTAKSATGLASGCSAVRRQADSRLSAAGELRSRSRRRRAPWGSRWSRRGADCGAGSVAVCGQLGSCSRAELDLNPMEFDAHFRPRGALRLALDRPSIAPVQNVRNRGRVGSNLLAASWIARAFVIASEASASVTTSPL